METGREFENVSRLALKKGILNKNFHILDSVSKSEMVNVMSAADIATSLFIPLEEMEANSANKFFDALASGRPIFINYGGWQAELLEDYKAGIRLDRNISLAANQIREFITNPDILVSYGTNSRTLGEANFSRDDLAKELDRVLKKAVYETTHAL